MRVIHESPRPPGDELVDEGLASVYGRLRQTRDTIHAIGKTLSVPVDTGFLAQPVGDEDAHAIALDHLNRGSGRLAVVAPESSLHAGRQLALHGLCHQMKLFDALVHPPRQGPAIERDHGMKWPPCQG